MCSKVIRSNTYKTSKKFDIHRSVTVSVTAYLLTTGGHLDIKIVSKTFAEQPIQRKQTQKNDAPPIPIGLPSHQYLDECEDSETVSKLMKLMLVE